MRTTPDTVKKRLRLTEKGRTALKGLALYLATVAALAGVVWLEQVTR